MWHLRYPLADGSGDVIVATTRPETMLGDTGVAVNPKDERYKNIVGKTCILPLVNKEIPIVADDYVDMEFGTGCVKMTPAHDPNALRWVCATIWTWSAFWTTTARSMSSAESIKVWDRYEARKAIVADLEQQGYLVKIEDHAHNVGTCYRCHNDVGTHYLRPVVCQDAGRWLRRHWSASTAALPSLSGALHQDLHKLDGKLP